MKDMGNIKCAQTGGRYEEHARRAVFTVRRFVLDLSAVRSRPSGVYMCFHRFQESRAGAN